MTTRTRTRTSLCCWLIVSAVTISAVVVAVLTATGYWEDDEVVIINDRDRCLFGRNDYVFQENAIEIPIVNRTAVTDHSTFECHLSAISVSKDAYKKFYWSPDDDGGGMSMKHSSCYSTLTAYENVICKEFAAALDNNNTVNTAVTYCRKRCDCTNSCIAYSYDAGDKSCTVITVDHWSEDICAGLPLELAATTSKPLDHGHVGTVGPLPTRVLSGPSGPIDPIDSGWTTN